jgi:hypothetical protein
MSKRFSWTRPWHGVQHLLGVPKPYQVSVTDYGSFADAIVINLHHNPFTTGKEFAARDAVEARRWAEKQAEKL